MARVPQLPGLREATPALPAGETCSELSGLLRIGHAAHLPAGWTIGFWAVEDEPPIDRALVRIGRRGDGSWELRRATVHLADGTAGDFSDCEAVARRGDTVYVFGSHFGRKKGPLDTGRQFVARFNERDSTAPHAVTVEIAADNFLLHRLVNDALVSAGVDLIARGTGEHQTYIVKTLRNGSTSATVHVRAADRAINVEGAAFMPDGMLLLGLRYPVTRNGHPIVVAVRDIDRLFTGGPPTIAGVWTIGNVGDAEQPTGIRDMMERTGQIDVLTGNLDRLSNSRGASAIIMDHPEGLRAASRHYRIRLPAGNAAQRPLQAELVRDLSPLGNVEGIAAAAGPGCDCYVLDEDGVRLLYDARCPGSAGAAPARGQ